MVKHLLNFSFKSNTYFGHNRGISVLFRLIHLYQRNVTYGKISASLDDFFHDLGKIFNENLIRMLDGLYGEGGDKAGAELIIFRLKEEFPKKYADMSPTLKHIPKKKIS
jgi:hypothetical protein